MLATAGVSLYLSDMKQPASSSKVRIPTKAWGPRRQTDADSAAARMKKGKRGIEDEKELSIA